ncbi:MAG: hypothetical protein RBR01_04710 [Desulfobacterales bacterium]|nr:hypothetical protein [Desulfobacterales bacterium]MDD3949554.1 hypothetical protein [Desulfobacterales bacterium]MDY0377718.1 hypothetical protein [Desulfobacterales bacterium]
MAMGVMLKVIHGAKKIICFGVARIQLKAGSLLNARRRFETKALFEPFPQDFGKSSTFIPVVRLLKVKQNFSDIDTAFFFLVRHAVFEYRVFINGNRCRFLA